MSFIDKRRPHWRITHEDVEDPASEAHRCFTDTRDAGEWLVEQLHERIVAEIKISRIDHRIAECVCGEDVTGRCHNSGCDRDANWDSEPGGDYPGYCRWYSTCSRCFGIEHATGGFTHRGKPLPKHHCIADHTAARLRKLIEGDEHVGWWCTEYSKGEDGPDPMKVEWEQCGQTWRLDDPSIQWQWRLTRAWNGKVTGTQGWALTQAEASAEAARLNARSAAEGWGFTVGVEPVAGGSTTATSTM